MLAPGGSTTVGGNQAKVDGAALLGGASSTYGAGRSIEFSAAFSAEAGQNAGFSSTNAVQPPFAMFGVNNAGTLLARSFSAGTSIETPIPGSWFSGFQNFRIDWTPTTVVYWINKKKVATHIIALDEAMQPAAFDSTVGNGTLKIAHLRMTPYAALGNYTSAVFDAGAVVTWATTSWRADKPAGTNIVLSYRTGATPTPDATWTEFTATSGSGGALSGTSRYFQFTCR